MNDIMTDIETLGTDNNSVILSIGAVRFNAYGDELGPTFYERISIDSCLDAGMTVNGRTILWWMEQGDAARAALTDDPGHALPDTLTRLARFIDAKDRVWGNGAAFDNAMLSSAFARTGIEQPWRFWNDSCFRTMKALAGASVPKPEEPAIAHHALHDAISQARHLQAIMARIGLGDPRIRVA